MIGYITLGSNDVQASAFFYDQIFIHIGAARVWDTPSLVAWGKGKEPPFFSITSPYNEEPATVGNGVMIAIKAPGTEIVDHMHKQALELGATNEGDPGNRQVNSYCAYCRDLDGNKLNFYCIP